MYNIIKFDEIDSTNKYALRELGNLQDEDIVLADSQTNGRGRLDRSWISPANKNLYFSIVIKNFQQKDKLNFLTIVAAVAIAKVLRNNDIEARIKWPNDVLVDDKKICGILAETNSQGIVVGVGLNVNMDKKSLKEIDQPATSMKTEVKKDFKREELLKSILNSFFDLYELVADYSLDHILDIWKDEMGIINQKVKVITPKKEFTGIVTSVESDGSLMVESDDKLEKVLTGDVKYVS